MRCLPARPLRGTLTRSCCVVPAPSARPLRGTLTRSCGLLFVDQFVPGGQQPALAERGAEQGGADRAAVRGGSRGDGDGGEVEQVRELRVPTQDEVARDRLGGQLGP